MGKASDRAQQTLLDSAEELFAQHGIDAVSNRRITEHAGTANHSAIAYHFGGREGLLEALLARDVEKMAARRQELTSMLGEDADLRSILACRIIPWIEQLASLPVPSWRARFFSQVRATPNVASLLARSVTGSDDFPELNARMKSLLTSIPPRVLEARSGILGQLIIGICAEYEGRIHDGSEEENWMEVGYFLIDAGAGLLAAAVTAPGNFPAGRGEFGLI